LNSVCQGHDALDWFAAIGPTIAAAAAAWAAWSAVKVSKQIHKESQALQRMIARPLLVVSSRVRHVGGVFNWIVEITNVGQTAANIESLTVFADRQKIVPELLEAPKAFWRRVLSNVSLPQIQVNQGNTIVSDFALAPDAQILLFDTTLASEHPQLDAAIRKVEIEITYVAPWGDRRTIRPSLAHDK